MLKEKSFCLCFIFTEKTPKTAKKLIANANANELNVLIQICHFIAMGEVPLKWKKFENIKKIQNYLDRFDNKNSVKKLLESSREIKKKVLTNIAAYFHDLLFLFFNEQ